MPRFRIYFEVETLLAGTIEVEAESGKDAADAFYRGDYDDARLGATLELADSEDGIVEIREIGVPRGFE
jgi:hypothetical protein